MNTKRTAAVLMCACMVLAFITGCKQLKQQTTTLQGTIFNAITGERIGGSDLKMYLQQGALLRTPDVFYTGKKKFFNRDNSTTVSQDLMGDYVFTNIPSMDNDTPDNNPNEYRVTVIKEGFQRFEGIIDNDMLADKDNVIRNIYLFPIDFEIPCYNYTVTFNGKPVDNATITLMPYATINPGIIATDKWLSTDLATPVEKYADLMTPGLGAIVGSAADVFTLFNNNYFFPAPGYLANISDKTDATGKVSFCDELATGAAYAACVYVPKNFEGVQLSGVIGPVEVGCNILIPGYSAAEQTFVLDEVIDTPNAYGLYVTSISNSVADQLNPAGTLVIKFNRAVEIGNYAPAIAPATDGFGIAFGLATAAVFPAAPASQVTASLSADGKTLTLTPTWTTAPAATELGQDITYQNNNSFIIVKGYADSNVPLNSLTDAYGNPISLTVHLYAD